MKTPCARTSVQDPFSPSSLAESFDSAAKFPVLELHKQAARHLDKLQVAKRVTLRHFSRQEPETSEVNREKGWDKRRNSLR